MNLLEKFTSIFPFGEKKISPEYYFALNISSEELTAALWKIEGNNLQIIETAADTYSSLQDILRVTDSLLDKVLGIRETEPEKILFGVPDSWLIDDDLRGEYLKVLRNMVKDLELTPMAYVATSHALIHLLEKQEGVPTTAILVGLESEHLVVSVVRAGRLDGTKVVERSSEGGIDIEKALLTFANVETLPSKILLYGMDKEKLEKIKNELHSFAWMQNLSFLHFPKIEALNEDIEIESICFAGGFELNSSATYVKNHGMHSSVKQMGEVTEITRDEKEHKSTEKNEKLVSTSRVVPQEEGSKNASLKLGFMVGDISQTAEKENTKFYEQSDNSTNENLMMPSERSLIEQEDIAQDTLEQKNTSILEKSNPLQSVKSFFINNFLGKSWSKGLLIVAIFVLLSGIIIVGYLMISKAEVRIFVEPQILEKETTVTSDPKQKEIDREAKVIPGQIVETEVSGSDSMQATGSREIGDSAKGTVIIRNKLNSEKTLSKGTILSTSSGLKFSLDTSVLIASRSADDGTWGKSTVEVTASAIGADGNLPSGTDLIIANYSDDQLIAKSEGNFSGGTSKKVTVVSDADQKKLLASVAANLRTLAKDKLQEKLPNKKVIEESLTEEIIRKSYNKGVNDQANEFSLNLTIKFKGTAFDEADLKQIVGDLVTTQVPEGFELSLDNTETQANVSKVEKDGRLVFSAKFRAKLVPKVDKEEIRNKIKGRTPPEVAEILKGMKNILGSEIQMNPSLPLFLQRLPIIKNNIRIEVGLK